MAGGDGFAGAVSRQTVLKAAVGFLVAMLVLYLLASGLGITELRSVLAGAELGWIALACLSTLLCLVCWGKAWQVVLREGGIQVPFRRLVVTYFAATFANYVTPLGQAGGEPFIAYVLSRDTGASYEDSLASVVTADLLNLVPFFTFAAGGLSWLVWRAELPAATQPLAVGLLGVALGVPALLAVGWRLRERLLAALSRAVAPIASRTDRVSVAGVRARLQNLFAAFERIAQEPLALVEGLAFAYLGWLFFALPLYLAGLALDVPVDPLLILFIVPASTLAGLTPAPGGLVGIELALVGMLVALTPIGAATAFAIALVYRLSSYWFGLVVGGGAALLVVNRS